eukprot:m.4149 g.4149  ORF g.4149 m.4149 type:complete len:60 (-) comp2179_c0_seq1:301-480(-)
MTPTNNLMAAGLCLLLLCLGGQDDGRSTGLSQLSQIRSVATANTADRFGCWACSSAESH